MQEVSGTGSGAHVAGSWGDGFSNGRCNGGSLSQWLFGEVGQPSLDGGGEVEGHRPWMAGIGMSAVGKSWHDSGGAREGG